MDISALSTSLSNFKLSQQVGISLVSMGKDLMEQQGQSLQKLVSSTDSTTIVNEVSAMPHLGGNVDIKV